MKLLKSNMNIYIVVLLCIISDSLASPIFKRWQRQVSALYTSVCDNKQMQLICFGDGEILRIESANYGRTDTQLCPSRLDTTNTNCSAENSFQIVSERCNGKDECRIPVNTGVFGGDPCPETEKYLEVSYFCETAAITPFSTVTTPSLAAARTTAATQLVTEEDGSFFTVVCENNQMSLTCFDGKVLKIVYANYGRTDEITCNSEEQNQDTNCRDPNSLQVVQNSCENNAACEIEVNNDVFSDLCIGVFKYLAVRYKCVIPSRSQTTSTHILVTTSTTTSVMTTQAQSPTVHQHTTIPKHKPTTMTPQHTTIPTHKTTTVTPQHTTIPTHKATTVTPQHTTIPTHKATTVTPQHTTIPTHKATTVTPQHTTIPTHKATTMTPQHTTIPSHKATTVTPQHTTIPTHKATTVTPQHTTILTHKATTVTPQHTTIPTHKATTMTPQHTTILTPKATTVTPQHTTIPTHKATTVTPQHTTIPTPKATTMTPQHTTIPTHKATTVTPQHTAIPTHKATTVTPQHTTIPTHKATTMTPQHTIISTSKATTVTPQHTTIPTHKATTVTPQHTTIPTPKATTVTLQHTTIPTHKATTVTPQQTTIPTHKATTVTPQHTTIPTPKATTVTPQHTTIPTHRATTVTPQHTTIPTHKATTVTPQHTTIPTPKATTVTPQHTTIPTHRATTVTPQHTTIPTHKATTLTPQHTTILTHKATTVTPQHSTMPVVETTTTTETATTPPHTTNKHTTPQLTTVINGSTKQHEAATPALTTSQQTASTKRTIPHGGGDTTVQTAEGQVTSITATPEKIKTVSYSSIEVTLTQSKETTAIGSTTPEHGGPTTVVIETTSVNGHTEPSIGPQLTTVAKETTTVDGHTEPPVVTDPPIVRTTEHQLETTTAPPTTMTKDLGIQTTTNQVTTQRPAPTTAQVTIPSRRSSIRKTTSVLMETTQGVTQHPGSTVPPATNLATQRSTTTPNKEFTDTDQPTTISQQSPTIPKVPTHATFWTSPRASPRDVTTQKSRGSTKDFTMTDFMMTRPSPDLYCEAATVRDIYWPVTMTGDTAKQFCPEGTTGEAQWICVGRPAYWTPIDGPNLSSCTSAITAEITKMIENISSVSDVAIVTSLMVNSTDPDQVMYGGDVIGSVNNINSLNKIIAEQSGIDEEYMLEFIDKVAMALTEVGSNLLDHTVAWNDIPGEKRVQTATQLLQCMDETGFLLVNLMKAGQNISVVNENILMEVLVKDMNDTDKAGIKFPFKGDLVHSSSADEKIKSTIGSIALSEKTLQDKSVNGTVKLVFFMYSTMGDILGTGSDIGNENDTADSIVNSPIISASINKMNSPSYLSEPAVLVFEHKQTYNVTDAVCSYWNFTPSNDGIWSDYGCETVTNNDTHTVCKCSHLTNFAVIMDVRGVAISPDHHFALSVITYAGFIVSMVCLLLCLFTFCCCSSLQNDRNTIHKNLCLCLLIAEVIFMAGIDQTDQEVWCSVIAGFLHYFFLAAFAWMSLEGIQLYVMLVEVFEAEHSRRRYYYPYGYGVPAVIVGVSAAVYYDGYGTDQYCWITTERGLIWAFVGPVCAVILVNMIFLVMAAVIMCRHSGSAPGKKQTGTWIKAACVLLCLLGITWIFGLMYINTHTLVMAYVFTIANSLQGLFIFVFHCCLNEKVKKAYRSSIRDSHCCPECIRVRYTSSAYSNQAHGSSVASSKKIRKSSNASCPSSTGKRNSSSVTHNLLGSNGTHNLHNGVGLQNVQVRVKLPRQDRATQTDNRIKKQNIIEKKLQEIVDLKFKLPPLEMKRTTSDSCLVSPTPNVQTSFTFEQSISNTSVDKFLSDDSNVHSSMPNLTIRKPKENKTKERDLAQVEWKLSRNQSLPDLLELEVINPAMTGYRRCGSECNIHTGNKERYDLSGRRDSSLPIKVLHTKIADKNGQPWSRISISPLLIRKSISDTKMIEETSINLNSNLFGSPNKSTVDDDNQVMLKKWRTDEDIAVSETPVYTSQDSEQTPDVEVKGIHTNSKYYESYL